MSQRPFQPDQPSPPPKHPVHGDSAPAPSLPTESPAPTSQRDHNKGKDRKPALRLASPGAEVPAPSEMDDPKSDVLASIGEVSRRINDLARELDCLGYFNDHDGNRPRAA